MHSLIHEKCKFDIKHLDSKDPLKQFQSWYQTAVNMNLKQPNAMCLATCTKEGKPSCRMISICDFNHNGFLFFTNYNSKKANEIESNPNVCVCFFWEPLNRQVVMNGKVKKISHDETVKHFKHLPFESQIKTLVCEQGMVIEDKEKLVNKQSELYKQLQSGHSVPTPENWGGYLFVPDEFDFWQGNADELDDRIRFRKSFDHENEKIVTRGENGWVIETLCP